MRLFGSRDPVTAATALPGRAQRPFTVPATHEVLGTPLEGPWPEGTQLIYLAMGCFWGAERIFWQQPGVVCTAVGYMGGFTPNPTYDETCTERTGHAETVLVAYDPALTRAEHLLKVFWENHDPTTANRQGNDVGTQYRSALYFTTLKQRQAVELTSRAFSAELARLGLPPITTEIRPGDEAGPFWYAEDYHQQYLHKNPGGYDCHVRTGVECRLPVSP